MLTAAVAQIRDGDGTVLGTGFLIAENLLISCAHVLDDGGYGPGDVVQLVFPRLPGTPAPTGRVLEEGWRDRREEDIALVLLDDVPVGTAPLVLGSAVGCRGHRVRSLGFPVQAPPGGHFGSAEVVGLLPAADRAGDLLQLTGANDLTTGFSGGPVLDEATGLVVGMVTAITAPDGRGRGQGIAYATPTEVLRGARPSLKVGDVSPYRGLEAFAAEHARWFRGREEAVRQAVAMLGGGPRVVLLLGPSGAGKSSLVQAGVLPELAGGAVPGSKRWHRTVVRPGPDLQTALEQAGLPVDADAGDGATPVGRLKTGPAHERVVLVVDQFEELLASANGPRTKALAALTSLAGAIRSTIPAPDVVLVLVMRDDFYPRLSALAPELLQAALDGRGVLNVPAVLTSTELTAIVTGPAGDLKVDFEAGLAQRIVSDVLALNPSTAAGLEAPITVLPLLGVALSQLWESRLDHDGRLTHDAYRRIGAVTGALTEWCNSALGELDEHQQRIAQRALTALVHPADEALNIPAARQQLPLGELRELAADDDDTPQALEAVDEVLTVLSRHRVITTDRVQEPGPTDPAVGTPMAELIHDALIRDWPTLRRWMEQDARFHDWLHRARTQYTRWQEQHDPRDLLAGTLVAEGTDLARHRRLPAELAAFLDAGRRRQEAAVRNSRRLNAVLATFLVLAMLTSAVAFWQRQKATAAQHTAQSRQLAAQSTALLDTDSDLASLLAVAAYHTDPTAEAATALRAAAALPLRRRLTGHNGGVNAVVFSPDGRTLATAGSDGTARLWDMATGKAITTLTGHSDGVNAVVFSPDGRTLATAGDDHTARLWDMATGRTLATLTGHTDIVNAVVFSPDGRTLATAGRDGTARLWDVATGKTTDRLTIHNYIVNAVVFSPDGRTLATAGSDHTVRLWDVATGKALTTLTGHTDFVNMVAFSPDGRTLATASLDGTAGLWDVATGKAVTSLTGHNDAVNAVVFSPDGRTLATAGSDGTARLWDVATGKAVTTLTGHRYTVGSVVFSPDGRTLATAGLDGTARLWDVATGKTTNTLTGHTDIVTAVVFSPDGRTLATASRDGTARLWDVATGRTITTLTGAVRSVVFSPDGRTLATAGYNSTARLWDVATGKALVTFTGHNDTVTAVAFSPDGRTLATASLDGTAGLWDVATGKAVTSLTGHTKRVTAVAFSPDGRTLATSSWDGTMRLWDVATGKTTNTLTGYTGLVGSVVFSPDGRTLATPGNIGAARLWDVATGKAVTSLTGHTDIVNAVVFSPDGRTLATAGRDGTARLWDVATGKTTDTLTGHNDAVSAVAFSPDGRTLATASRDHTVRLWTRVPPAAAIRAICDAVARDLAPEEKTVYLPPDQAGQSACPQGFENQLPIG
ncbi:trypsin-like peptidase domain-containing protein [Kitasatospora sp. NPDC058032]|uniref:nSTAND1 domain-containing NTPase n=1 Tax=Kitasatospora sp. NPDC058032 TaxID=3346307 RepID=UPI0036D96117